MRKRVIGKTGRDHPDTSFVAARTPTKETQQVLVFELVEDADDRGITCYAVAHKLGMSPNQVATRMQELREKPVGDPMRVWRTPEKRTTTSGNSGYVHKIWKFRKRYIPRSDPGATSVSD